MPGPKKFRIAKAAVIFSEDINKDYSNILEEFSNRYIKYEIAGLSKDFTDQERIEYAQNAKKNGLEVVLVIADAKDKLPAIISENCKLPVIFCPVSDNAKSVPQKILGASSFTTVAINKINLGVKMALKIIAIRDKSLARRLWKNK